MSVVSLVPAALLCSAAIVIWLAVLVQKRPLVRGAVPFIWLLGAIAWWCLTGAAHALSATVEVKEAWARIQYLGIAAVPPLWLLFAAAYAGAEWLGHARRQVALWTVPALTVLAAATNDVHRAVWVSVTLTGSGLGTYEHGWWFWVNATHSYLLVLAGALFVTRSLRRSPPPFRAQHHAMLAGAVMPLFANVLYVAGLSADGLDLTPHAFACSGLLFAWALFRHRLFDLVPVARDMVVDSLSDAVIVVDRSRRVLDMNNAAVQLAGERREWHGRAVDEVLPLLRDQALDFRTNGPSLLTLASDDRRTFYDLRLMPVRTRSRDLGAWVLLLRDITQQRLSAIERDELTVRIQEQQQRESLSALAGSLARDFSGLLSGIVGSADLLTLKLEPSSEAVNSVGAILVNAQRAADLVDKMLAYAGERHGSTVRLDLDELVRDLLDLLQASVARHCRLHYEGTPAFIEADATQVRQVAMNLIINAAEAVPERTGVVRIRTAVERLSARQLTELDASPDAVAGMYAYLEVRDNGPGMDAQTLERIFVPFFTTKPHGRGLGLSVVQGIVRAHHGALRADSTPGYGAKLCVWFPLAGAGERGDDSGGGRTVPGAMPSADVPVLTREMS